MFDPINGPNNEYGAPAVGHGSENGDSWHTAVAKINAGFKSIIKAIESGTVAFVADAPDDAALGDRLSQIEDTLAALQAKLDALTAPAAPAANTQPAAQQTQNGLTQAPNVPDPNKPVTAIPVTTNTTFIGAGNPAAQ